MTRREAIHWLLAGGAFTAASGCTRRVGEKGPEPRVTLVLWVLEEGVEPPDIYQQIVDEYMRLHPDVRITIERRANDAYKESLRLAINTPTAPDAYFSWSGVGLGGFYVRAGGARRVEEYYDRYGWRDRFAPATLTSTYFDGGQYGIPIRSRAMAVYYRKDAFAKAGIKSKPITFAELLEANDRLRTAGYAPLAMAGKFGWMTMRLLDCLLETMCGAKVHDALREFSADWSVEPGVTKAFREFKRWADVGYLPRGFLGLDPMAVRMSVYRGKAAMMIEGDWMVEILANDEMDLADYDFFPFPTETNRLYFFADEFFISSTTQHPDEVAKFYDYWTSPETQQRHATQFGTLPPTLGLELGPDRPLLAREWQETAARYKAVFWPGDQALPIEVYSVYARLQAEVLSGVVAPEDAGRAMQAEIKAYQTRQRTAVLSTKP